MKKKLMDILVCPMCKGELVLENTQMQGEEIISGSLYCRACDEKYPIQDGIPRLLPPLRGRQMERKH